MRPTKEHLHVTCSVCGTATKMVIWDLDEIEQYNNEVAVNHHFKTMHSTVNGM